MHVDVETCILKKAQMLFVLVTVDEKTVDAMTSRKEGSQSSGGTKGRETGDEMKYRHGNTAEWRNHIVLYCFKTRNNLRKMGCDGFKTRNNLRKMGCARARVARECS